MVGQRKSVIEIIANAHSAEEHSEIARKRVFPLSSQPVLPIDVTQAIDWCSAQSIDTIKNFWGERLSHLARTRRGMASGAGVCVEFLKYCMSEALAF